MSKKDILYLVLSISTAYLLFFQVLDIGCPILFLTGIPCFGCGMTRACVSLLHLDFKAAFAYHPMCFALPLIAGILVFKRRIPNRLYRILIMTVILLFIIVYLARLLSPADDIIKINLEEGFLWKLFQILIRRGGK